MLKIAISFAGGPALRGNDTYALMADDGCDTPIEAICRSLGRRNNCVVTANWRGGTSDTSHYDFTAARPSGRVIGSGTLYVGRPQ
jgi:hypothetical protein